MRRIAISLGHNPDDQGAAFDGYTEYSSLAPLFGYLVSFLCYFDIQPYIVPTGSLTKKIEYINGKELDFAIELHMNADMDGDQEGDPVADGCEMLYYDGSVQGERFARSIQRSVVENFCIRDRGVKPEAQFSFLKRTNCPAIIAELGFIDDINEANMVRSNAAYLASLVASGINSALLT